MNKRYDLLGVLAILLSVAPVAADPPPPETIPTICPLVQCMRVTGVTDNLDGTFDVEFENFNWFNTTADTGVNRLLMFTGNLRTKKCIGGINPFDIQVDVLGATAPPGWSVVQADNDKVEFAATSSIFDIPELDLCDPSVIGGCINGGGPGISTCGNNQGGFVVTLRPSLPSGEFCSWTANWRQFDDFGIDNGDVMKIGAV